MTTREQKITQAFVLDAKGLKELINHLQEWITSFSFEVTGRDSLTRESSTLDDLIGYTYITRLRITGHSEDKENTLSLQFTNDTENNIHISLKGNEDTAVAMSDTIDHTLAAMKPWYGILARMDFFLLMCAAMLIPSFLIIFAVGSGVLKLQATSTFTGQSAIVSVSMGVSCAMAVMALGLILNKTKGIFFPMGSFRMGYTKKETP